MQEMQEMWVQPLDQEDHSGGGYGIHPSVLAWRIPWIEKPGGLQSVRSQWVRHDWSNLSQTTRREHVPLEMMAWYINLLIYYRKLYVTDSSQLLTSQLSQDSNYQELRILVLYVNETTGNKNNKEENSIQSVQGKQDVIFGLKKGFKV